jgi:RNA polymerase-interacting CarD/CdnL/TRCF family regulator
MFLTKENKLKIIESFVTDPENELMPNLDSMLRTAQDDLDNITNDIYFDFIGIYENIINQLPDYFFVMSPTITVDGVDDLQLKTPKKMIPNFRVVLESEKRNELIETISKVNKAKELRASIIGKLKDILTVNDTSESLLEVWPELHKYIPETPEILEERKTLAQALKENIDEIMVREFDFRRQLPEEKADEKYIEENEQKIK